MVLKEIIEWYSSEKFFFSLNSLESSLVVNDFNLKSISLEICSLKYSFAINVWENSNMEINILNNQDLSIIVQNVSEIDFIKFKKKIDYLCDILLNNPDYLFS